MSIELSEDERHTRLTQAVSRARFPIGPGEGQSEWVHGALTDALMLYTWKTGNDPGFSPPPRTERKHLLGVIKSAEALRHHLRALSVEDQMALGVPPAEVRREPDGTHVVVPHDPLQDIIDRTNRMQQQRAGGRPSNDALDGLLLVITVQWRCAFDPDPLSNPFLGIVYHGNATNDAQRYKGPLLDFALDVLKSQGIPSVRSAVGRRLYDLMGGKWGMRRHENPPSKSH
jgi:hypothetical protein